MNEYETEEQQVEALKKWWKENGTSLVVGLFVGVSALFGWRYYNDQQHVHAVQASDIYVQVMQGVAFNNIDDKVIDLNNKLINGYADTPYASLSSLALAKAEYEKGNVENAATQLELAARHANDEITTQIANLRLVAVYIELAKYDEAEALLNMEHNELYDAQYEELRGDLYNAQGNVDLARMAYDKALSLQGLSASKWLKLKRQNLGVAASSTDQPT